MYASDMSQGNIFVERERERETERQRERDGQVEGESFREKERADCILNV